jgi:hypothetical protein
MKKLILFTVCFTVFLSCNNRETKIVNKEYTDYLKSYEDLNPRGDFNSISFRKINGQVFWITSIQGAGSVQLYYWINENNLLIPQFNFNYGGINWEEPIEYSFLDINSSNTKIGNARQEDIDELIEVFVIENFKKNQR